MESKTRRVICWKCDELFRVDVSSIASARIVVTRGADKRKQEQTPQQKLIVKCPNCNAENEVRV